MRRIITPTVVAIAAAAMLSPFPATAEAARTRSAFASTTAKPTELFGLGATGAPRPELCEAASAECLVPFIGYDQLTGAIEGSQVNAGSLSFNFATGTGWAVSLAHFTGSAGLSRCGDRDDPLRGPPRSPTGEERRNPHHRQGLGEGGARRSVRHRLADGHTQPGGRDRAGRGCRRTALQRSLTVAVRMP